MDEEYATYLCIYHMSDANTVTGAPLCRTPSHRQGEKSSLQYDTIG